MKLEELAESSRLLYQRAVEFIPGDIHDYDYIMEYSKDKSVHQKKTLYKALIHYDPENKDKYYKLINEFSRQERKVKKEGNLRLYSKNEMELLRLFKVVMEENDKSLPYIKKYKELRDGTMEKALIMLHLYHPLRSDYYSVKIKNHNEGDNFYKDGKITFNSMVKVNRRTWVNLDEEERKVLDSYIATLPETQEKLFTWKSSNTYNKALSRIASEIFGEPFGVNKFRHLKDLPEVVKELYNDINRLAKSMNHTLATHVEKY
jgi:DNA-binding transcriptional MerR regulator